jgi:hypothetical protein
MKKLYYLLASMAVILMLARCEKDDGILFQGTDKETPTDNAIKLGKKLKNPYSVENMQKAYDNLNKRETKSSSDIKITTTHIYVKFKPKNEEELSILESDTILILYDYPLDYEILQNGDYYHDPELPKNQPTYQYASVKIEQELPNEVDYEILSELFIPDEDKIEKSENSVKSSKNNGLIDKLVDEALRITNNFEEESKTKSLFGGSKWRPAGKIMAWDDNFGNSSFTERVFSHWEYYDCDDNDPKRFEEQDMLQRRPIDRCKRAVYKYVKKTIPGSYVAIEGVKVRARRWFTTHTGIVNSQGYFSCDGRFRRPANYDIYWKRDDFSIRWSSLSSAKYSGPKRKGDWNLSIKGGTQEFYATIFRAAHHYYYKNIKGLRRPPQNSFWKTQLKIRAYYEQNNSANGNHAAWRRFLGLGSAIKIYNPQNDSKDIYATVIHELAHASHWNMDRSDFNDTESKVKESWARGVQWELTRIVYAGYHPSYFGDYTGIVEDMIDGLSGYDQVGGYTIRQIEDALKHQESWNSWKNNIKNKYSNGTEKNLDALFNHWN